MNTKLLPFIFLFTCILFFKAAQAQVLYGNEWITDYTKTYYKIKVAKDGLYRINQATLQSLGLAGNAGSTFVLYGRGNEVPIYVSNTNIFNTNDFIEFYAQKNDGWLDDWLFNNPASEHLNPYYSIFNDTAIYFLAAIPGSHLRINATINNSSTQAAEPYCFYTSMYEGHSSNSGGVYYNYGTGYNIAASTFDEAEGYFGFYFNSSYSYSLPTPGLYTANPNLNCTAEAISSGLYTGSNGITVNINGSALGTATFNNVKMTRLASSTIPASVITSPSTTFNFTATQNTYNGVSSIKLRYPRLFNCNSNNEFKFEIESATTSFTNKKIAVTNFNAQSSDAVLYDLDNNLRMVDVNNGGSQTSFNFFLPPSLPSARKIYLSNETNVNAITALQPVRFIDYHLATHQGSFIIISHPALHHASDGHDYVQEYAAYRNDIVGGSYDTVVADINQLYDQFAYGIVKHPLAIRNFAHFANDFFTKPKPFYVFLIGKGQMYPDMKATPSRYTLGAIPTFGYPGSDELLTGFNNTKYSQIAISRISVFNGKEVKVYLDKVAEYERQQRETCISGEQNLTDKNWMKQVIHLVGGVNAGQQSVFDGYLNTLPNNPMPVPMKQIIEDTSFGGYVSVFKKSSSLPIQLSASAQLDSLINAGVSVINFFGHSAYSTLEFAIDNPSSYKNYGKYPFVISNGCFTGNLFEDPAQDPYQRRGLSEQFIVADSTSPRLDIGAIGYISTSDLGISSGLNIFTNTLYQNISEKNYGNTIGECLRITRDSLLRNVNPFATDVIVSSEQMLLNGDPAVRINPHAKPDYYIDSTLIKLNPATITFEQGTTFHVKFGIVNLGKAVNDSINVLVMRYFPNADLSAGSAPTLLKTLRIKAPLYREDFDVIVNTEPDRALGANRICIIVDAQNEVDEICENNNDQCIEFNISSLDILPIYPYQFSIVSDTSAFTLKGSTVDPFAPTRKYRFQIDTTEKFNSTFFQSTFITQSGGVVSWRRPPLQWKDSTVYYWRVAVDTLYGNHNLIWHNTSFTYIKGSSPGWDQSHYYEFKKDDFNTVFLDSDRVFKFAHNIRSVKIVDYGNGTDDGVAPFLDYQKLNNGGSCIPYGVYGGPSTIYGGFNIVVFDSSTGIPLTSGFPLLQQGDYNCSYTASLPIFQYVTNGYLAPGTWHTFAINQAPDAITQRSYLTNYLTNYVPNGDYVLMYSINQFAPQNFEPALKNAFTSLLGTTVIDTMTNSRTYVYFGRKGGYGFPKTEITSPTVGGLIDTTLYFSGHWYKGTITTPLIGPASSWSSLHWKYFSKEFPSADSTGIDLIGVDVNNVETVLYSNTTLTQADVLLSFVNATTYPFLKIRMTTQDTTYRTPSQLKYWRINYSPMPEVALDKHTYLTYHADTLQRGDALKMKICVRNVSAYNFDTLYMKYTIVKQNNTRTTFQYKLRKLPGLDTVLAYFTLNTNNYAGLNTLLIEANPYGGTHKDEQFHFNNIGKMNFFVTKDYVNPLLDVTFDEQHILDGDIVSAKPQIFIKLKDENKFLALDTITLLTAWIKSPNSNSYVQQNLVNSGLIFTPATNASTNNTATIKMNPIFKGDGEYRLRVQGYDKSNNISGDLNYEVSFNIVNKPMISNVLNYPNPFTTQTRFVFTLTGSELPSYFKIQIMTISGKIVRELTLAELGTQLHIGKNITNYAWDGTDQYGSALANGLYLYRVVTSLHNNTVEHYTTSADKYFKSGFGKMYLMR